MHTPGPWATKEGDRSRREMSLIAKACDADFIIGYAICEAQNKEQREEDLANARLIAAAPDLLSALQGVLRIADRKTAEFDAARAAIAKAEGK